MAESSKSWYETFLSSMIVMPNAQSPQGSVFYALKILLVDYKELEQGDYALHFLFFDTTEKKFFGRQFKNMTIIKNNRLEIEHKVLFFHTSVTDDRVLIVCELVKLERNPWVVAWTVIPLVLRNQSITDYNSHFSESIQPNKHRFYKGSCICLMYLNDLNDLDQKLRKVDGIITTLIQTNSSMNCAVSFMPEYFLTSVYERIPGLIYEDGNFNVLDTFTGVIDNAILSYSTNSQPTEQRILNMLMHDYCLRMNQSVQKCETRKFEIIERRLKVGVHNGLCYIEEPHFLYLYDKEECPGTFRKRSKSTGKNTESYSEEFITRSCVRLIRLCADNVYAIVFSVDYLVGFRGKDNLINESQWLMIAWNAWSPFRNGTFTIADTITVPLVGGPRPNPDDIFCFKSLIKNEQKPMDDLFADNNSHFNLRFNFAIVEATNSALLMMPQRQLDVIRATPLPNPDLPPLISPESFKNRDHEQSISEQFVEQDISGIGKEEIVAPIPTNIVALEDNQNVNIRMKRSRSVPVINTKSSVAPEYVEDFNESRISAFPRAISHYFMQFDFPSIVEPTDTSPKFVDPSEKRQILTELELNSFFSTSEIVIQLMGIYIIPNHYFSAVQRRSSYFFTLQFYRFGEVTTERLLAPSNTEWHSEKPTVFKRIDENNTPIKADGNGFTMRFTVGKSSIPPNDAEDFVRYLISDKLHIEVWNADSLLHIGTCSIPMQCLCRQNSSAVMTNIQCAIVQEGISDGPVTSGLLFLKMANIGRPAAKNMQTTEKRFVRLCHQNNSERFSLRARPLNAVHESALQRFLSTQKLDLCQRKAELFSSDSLRRVQQWNEIKKGATPLNVPMKRFIFREELEAYKTLRNKSKASALLRAVFKGITTCYTLYAKYGQVEFFEFLLRNTFADQVLCVVEVDDPRLSVVLDMDEWKFYKAAFHLRTPIERDLFTVGNDGKTMILLNAMESVCVPFKFDSQRSTDSFSRGNQFSIDSEIRAIFKRVNTEEPIGILEVFVQNRNVLINRSYRSFCEESRKVSRLFRIRGVRGDEQIISCRSSDPTVLCSLRKCTSSGQDVFISCNADYSPNVKTFLVMLYGDKYFSRQLAVWKFSMHSTRRLDVQAIQAQLTKIPLPLGLPIEQCSEDLLQLYSSSEAVTFNPPKAFLSDVQLLCNVQALFVPNFAGKRIFFINLVDTRISRLLLSWIVHAFVGEPNIVKVYDVKVPLNADMLFSKKIELVNAYSIPRKFRVHTSNVKIVSAEEEYYSLPPNSSSYIQLNFNPISNSATTKSDGSYTVQAFVFVENAETTEHEEAYSLRIMYTND